MSRIEIGREQENGPNGRNFPGKWNNRGRSGGFSRENKPTGEASVKEEKERERKDTKPQEMGGCETSLLDWRMDQ